MRWARIFNQE